MDDDLKAAIAEAERACSPSGQIDGFDFSVDVSCRSLRTLLTALRQRDEALTMLRRIRENRWIQPQHWNVHDRPRVREMLAEIDAILTGSETNAR